MPPLLLWALLGLAAVTGVSGDAYTPSAAEATWITKYSPPDYYPYGVWQGMQACPSGQAVCGFEVRMESDSAVDDTALNGLRFVCCGIANWNAPRSPIQYPGDGFWGSWSGYSFMPANVYARGGSMRVEAHNADPDDVTGLNAVNLWGTDGRSYIPSYGYWGGWPGGDVYCPDSSLITGLELRIHPPQSGGDDTAAVAVRWQCSCAAGSYPSCGASSCTCPLFTTCGVGHEETTAPTSFCRLGVTGCNRVCTACVLGTTYQDVAGSVDCKP